MKASIRHFIMFAILLGASNPLIAQSTDRELYLSIFDYSKVITPKSSRITLSEKYGGVPIIDSSILNELEKLDPVLQQDFMKNNGCSDDSILTEQDEFATYLRGLFDEVAYLFVSRIGYNANKTKAILYMTNLFHNLAGGGFLAICKQIDGKWQIEIKNVMAV